MAWWEAFKFGNLVRLYVSSSRFKRSSIIFWAVRSRSANLIKCDGRGKGMINWSLKKLKIELRHERWRGLPGMKSLCSSLHAYIYGTWWWWCAYDDETDRVRLTRWHNTPYCWGCSGCFWGPSLNIAWSCFVASHSISTLSCSYIIRSLRAWYMRLMRGTIDGYLAINGSMGSFRIIQSIFMEHVKASTSTSRVCMSPGGSPSLNMMMYRGFCLDIHELRRRAHSSDSHPPTSWPLSRMHNHRPDGTPQSTPKVRRTFLYNHWGWVIGIPERFRISINQSSKDSSFFRELIRLIGAWHQIVINWTRPVCRGKKWWKHCSWNRHSESMNEGDIDGS